MPSYLWNFSTTTSSNSNTENAAVPIPALQAAGGSGGSDVNVVRDFYWTYSKTGADARAEVPRVLLTERRLKTNALVSQLKYSLGALKGGLGGVSSDLGSPNGGGASTKLKDLIASLQAGAAAAGNAAGQITGGKSDDNNSTISSSPLLKPYQELYITEPTGWTYLLPYFENSQFRQTNEFQHDAPTGKGMLNDILKTAAEEVTNVAETISSLASPLQITYVEKTKFYNYPDSGEDITIEFPLINTGGATYEDVIKNWQFLFLLVYQNRPGKTGFNTVDQPVIYEVEVLGTKFYPYCYISDLNVEFMGSRRAMSLSIPSTSSVVNASQKTVSTTNSTQDFQTIIPDAYRVSITLRSMTASSRNFMAHMVTDKTIIQTK
jgi:hypothetical protein